jgi:hypothetical protein
MRGGVEPPVQGGSVMTLVGGVVRVAVAVVAAGVVAGCRPAQAQGCSKKEVSALVAGIQRLVELIKAGDVDGIAALDRELTAELSPACVAAIQAAQKKQPENPDQACTEGERATVQTSMQRAVQAMLQLDMEGYVAALRPLNGLSAQCQAAVAAAIQANQQPKNPGYQPKPRPARETVGGASVVDYGGGAYGVPGQVYCPPQGGCLAY